MKVLNKLNKGIIKRLFGGYFNAYTFTSQIDATYEYRKACKYEQKTMQKFHNNSIQLVQKEINVHNLVPNFFTSNLTLQLAQPLKVSSPSSNSFLNSYTNLLLPLSSNIKMRLKLNNVIYKGMRIGRLFEIMDSVAGMVTYQHCSTSFQGSFQDNKIICVTGSVESLHLFDQVDIENDLSVQGYLNYVGRTSMQVTINVIQNNILKACSLFTMIARNARDSSKGENVPELDFSELTQPERQKAKHRLEQAKANVLQRRLLMQTSYDVCPPSVSEIEQIHQIFLRRKQERNLHVSSSIPICETVVSNTQVMHSQERNLHGKIFGGFLIREMIELGVVAGCKYAQDTVVIEDLTNIYFKKPVDVGCRLYLKAMVTYIYKNRMVITVEAYTSLFTKREETLACYLHIIVKANQEMKEVHPESYEEGLQYLSSHKAFMAVFE